MNERQEKVCDLLCAYGREEILKYFAPDSCIASTKVAIKVLRHFKLKANPLVVHLEIMNNRFREKMKQVDWRLPDDRNEQQRWVNEGAWSICIDSSNDVGHLVTIVNGQWLIDLSIDQANRPHKSIILKPNIAYLPPNFLEKGVQYFVNDCSVSYFPELKNEIFRTSNDWRLTHRTQPVIKALIKRIKKDL